MSVLLPIATVSERLSVSGQVGLIDTLVDFPAQSPLGVALIGHSHPLLGGTAEDEVTHTIALALRDLGYISLRPCFRGTGGTDGIHDKGEGETEDLLAVHHYAARHFRGLPILLAGFSFGAFVQSKVAQRLADVGSPAARLILVSTALGNVRNVRFYATKDIPPNSLLIHGTLDNRVPLETVMHWAERQGLSVVVVPGADHFFNGKLNELRNAIQASPHRQIGR